MENKIQELFIKIDDVLMAKLDRKAMKSKSVSFHNKYESLLTEWMNISKPFRTYNTRIQLLNSQEFCEELINFEQKLMEI